MALLKPFIINKRGMYFAHPSRREFRQLLEKCGFENRFIMNIQSLQRKVETKKNGHVILSTKIDDISQLKQVERSEKSSDDTKIIIIKTR